MFERTVLSKISSSIKLGVVELSNNKSSSKQFKSWFKNYNIQYFRSWNISCLHYFSKSQNLKIIFFCEFPSCEEAVLDMFLQLKYLHILSLGFKKSVRYFFFYIS